MFSFLDFQHKTLFEFEIINRDHLYHNGLALSPRKVEALADEVIVEVTCELRMLTCTVTSTGSIHTRGKVGCGKKDFLLRLVLPDLSSKGVISVSV